MLRRLLKTLLAAPAKCYRDHRKPIARSPEKRRRNYWNTLRRTDRNILLGLPAIPWRFLQKIAAEIKETHCGTPQKHAVRIGNTLRGARKNFARILRRRRSTETRFGDYWNPRKTLRRPWKTRELSEARCENFHKEIARIPEIPRNNLRKHIAETSKNCLRMSTRKHWGTAENTLWDLPETCFGTLRKAIPDTNAQSSMHVAVTFGIAGQYSSLQQPPENVSATNRNMLRWIRKLLVVVAASGNKLRGPT